MNNYLKTYYSKSMRPPSNYPNLLAGYLKSNYFNDSISILDIACGRGDYLNAFTNLGMKVRGVDIDPDAIELCNPHKVDIVDISSSKLPYEDKSFDCVFNKSIIEHLHEPEALLNESHRVLKDDGVLITLCPSWEFNSWGPFYLDHTHVTPFTKPSLRDIHLKTNFEVLETTFFRQLPHLWKFPFLKIFNELVRRLPIPYAPMHDVKYNDSLNKYIRFSNEVMLLCVSKKRSK